MNAESGGKNSSEALVNIRRFVSKFKMSKDEPMVFMSANGTLETLGLNSVDLYNEKRVENLMRYLSNDVADTRDVVLGKSVLGEFLARDFVGYICNREKLHKDWAVFLTPIGLDSIDNDWGGDIVLGKVKKVRNRRVVDPLLIVDATLANRTTKYQSKIEKRGLIMNYRLGTPVVQIPLASFNYGRVDLCNYLDINIKTSIREGRYSAFAGLTSLERNGLMSQFGNRMLAEVVESRARARRSGVLEFLPNYASEKFDATIELIKSSIFWLKDGL